MRFPPFLELIHPLTHPGNIININHHKMHLAHLLSGIDPPRPDIEQLQIPLQHVPRLTRRRKQGRPSFRARRESLSLPSNFTVQRGFPLDFEHQVKRRALALGGFRPAVAAQNAREASCNREPQTGPTCAGKTVVSGFKVFEEGTTYRIAV